MLNIRPTFGYPRNFSGLTNVVHCLLVDGTAAMVGEGRLGAETAFPMSASGKLAETTVGMGEGRLGAETAFPMSASGKVAETTVGNATPTGKFRSVTEDGMN